MNAVSVYVVWHDGYNSNIHHLGNHVQQTFDKDMKKWRGIKRHPTEKGRIKARATDTGEIHQHQFIFIST